MRRIFFALILPLFLALAACDSFVYAPGPGPGAPAPPTPAPPPVPQPPPDPPEAPVAVAELVARLAAGSTAAEAEEVFGRAADNVAPAFGPAPETRRWFVVEADQKWMVYAVFRAGKVTGAGSAKVVEVP